MQTWAIIWTIWTDRQSEWTSGQQFTFKIVRYDNLDSRRHFVERKMFIAAIYFDLTWKV